MKIYHIYWVPRNGLNTQFWVPTITRNIQFFAFLGHFPFSKTKFLLQFWSVNHALKHINFYPDMRISL